MTIATAEKKLRENTEAEHLSLQDEDLTDLTPLLPLLAKHKRLASLNLSNNDLQALPSDLSCLTALTTLTLHGNRRLSLQTVVDGLATLPSLTTLTIDLPTETEEDMLIVSLPNLTHFNGISLEVDEQEAAVLKEAAPPSSASAQRAASLAHITARVEAPDVTAWREADTKRVDALFSDATACVSQPPAQEFFDYMNRVVKHVTCLTAADDDPYGQEGEVLKARRLLLEYCFDEATRAVAEKDPALGRSVHAVQAYTCELFDHYDTHWRRIVRERDARLVIMKRDMKAAIREIESLMARTEEEAAAAAAQTSSSHGVSAAELVALDQEIGRLRTENAQLRAQVAPTTAAPAVAEERGTAPRSAVAVGPAGGSSPAPRPAPQRAAAKATTPRHSVRSRSPRAKKVFTLKQLKELIEDIYTSKTKYDEKCRQTGLPRETMEQHMYTYLNQRYGLKELIEEYATSIVHGIQRFATEDNDVAVFGKILRNEVEEAFRYVQRQVRETVRELLRAQIKDRHPFKSGIDTTRALEKKLEGSLSEEEWVSVVTYMYNERDSAALISLIKGDLYRQRRTPRPSSSPRAAEAPKLDSRDLVRVLQDFQLDGHERFLADYVAIFRAWDRDGNGIVSDYEFQLILKALCPEKRDTEIEAMVRQADPLGCQLITFSETVDFLADELVQRSSLSARTNDSMTSVELDGLRANAAVSTNVLDQYDTFHGVSAVELAECFMSVQRSNIHTKPLPKDSKEIKKLLARVDTFNSSQLNAFLYAYMYPTEPIPTSVLNAIRTLCVNCDNDWVFRCQSLAFSIFIRELQARGSNIIPRASHDDPVALAQLRRSLPALKHVPKVGFNALHYKFVGTFSSDLDVNEQVFCAVIRVQNNGSHTFEVELSQTQTVIDGVKVEGNFLHSSLEKQQVRRGETIDIRFALREPPRTGFSDLQQVIVLSVDCVVKLFVTMSVISPRQQLFGQSFPGCLPLQVVNSPLGDYAAPFMLQVLKHELIRQQGLTSPSVIHLLAGKSSNYRLHNQETMKEALRVKELLSDQMSISGLMETFWASQPDAKKAPYSRRFKLPPSAAQPAGYLPAVDLPTQGSTSASPELFPNGSTRIPDVLRKAPSDVIMGVILIWLSEFDACVFDSSFSNCDPITYLETMPPYLRGVLMWVLDLCCALLINRRVNGVTDRALALTFSNLLFRSSYTTGRTTAEEDDSSIASEAFAQSDSPASPSSSAAGAMSFTAQVALRQNEVTAFLQWITLFYVKFEKAL